MGWPLAMAVLFLIVLIALGVAVWSGGFLTSASEGEVDVSEGVESGTHVRYEVPEGQDPAVVMAALEHAGYTAVPDTHTPRQVVAIALRERTAEDREHLRSVLAEVRSTNMGGPAVLPPTPVRFLDEETGSTR